MENNWRTLGGQNVTFHETGWITVKALGSYELYPRQTWGKNQMEGRPNKKTHFLLEYLSPNFVFCVYWSPLTWHWCGCSQSERRQWPECPCSHWTPTLTPPSLIRSTGKYASATSSFSLPFQLPVLLAGQKRDALNGGQCKRPYSFTVLPANL